MTQPDTHYDLSSPFTITKFSRRIKKLLAKRPVFLQDVAVVSLAQGISGFILICYTFIAARVLGRDDYGLFQSVMGIYGLLTAFGLPLNIVTIHCIAKANDQKKPSVLGVFIKISLAMGGVFALLVIIFSRYLANFLQANTIFPFLALGVLLLVTLLLTTFYGGLQGRNLYVFFSKAKIVETFITLTGGVLLMVLAGISGAVWGYVGGMTAVSLFLFTRRELYSFQSNSYSIRDDLTSIIKPLAVFGTILFVANFPMIIARARLPEGEAGLFGALFSLRNIVVPFALAVAIPLYSRTISRHNDPRMFFKAILVVIGFASMFLAVGLIAPEFFLQVVYGKDFVGAAPFMTPYGIFLLLHVVCMVVLFRQAADNTLIFPLLLIPIIIVSSIAVLADPSIGKIMLAQIFAWITYLCVALILYLITKRQSFLRNSL